MDQAEAQGMQGLTWKALECLDQRWPGPLGRPGPRAVRSIADQRMADRGEMDADLMGASGLELDTQQTMPSETFEDSVARARGASIGDHGHARALGRMAADRGVDPAPGDDLADHQRTILSMHLPSLELRDQ